MRPPSTAPDRGWRARPPLRCSHETAVPIGTRKRGRLLHRAGDGEHLVRQRPAFGGGGDVDESLDIVDHHADGMGMPAGGISLPVTV